MRLAWLGPVLLVALLATGCKSDQDRYCDAVQGHQEKLGELLGGDSADALLQALPIFEDLADDAPEDIRDDWTTVVHALQKLQDALHDAGVDPATYDRNHPPSGLSDADKEKIDAAAAVVGSEATATALDSVDQEAKDVCGTPLRLG